MVAAVVFGHVFRSAVLALSFFFKQEIWQKVATEALKLGTVCLAVPEITLSAPTAGAKRTPAVLFVSGLTSMA